MKIFSPTISGSSQTSGSFTISGSLNVSQGITGSLLGTASWAINVVNGGGGSTDTGSLLKTASVNLNTITFTKGDGSTFPITVDTGSGGGGSVGTLAQVTALGASTTVPITASIISASSFTGSLFGTASWAINALTASFLPVATYNITSSWAQSASNAVNSRTASFLPVGTYNITASWAQSASNTISSQTASFLPVGTYNITSSWATNALTASFVNNLNQNLSITGAVILSGSPSPELRVIGDTQFTGSVNSLNGFTGSLFGTSSWALNVVGGGGGGGVTINNNVDNYIITATGTANTLNGESTLTFDGTTLTVVGNAVITAIDIRDDANTGIGEYAAGAHIARNWPAAGGPSITAGNIVYFSGSSQWADAQANATGSSTRVLGVVTDAADPNEILLQGTITINTKLSTYQVGQPVYLSPISGGRVTNIPPSSSGHVARYVGWVIDTSRDQIYFNPDFTWIQI